VIRPLRRVHRWTFAALAFALPIVLLIALGTRP
jgi:hypothetical protein